MANLLLFDIDGTLVLTGRAGLRAMVRAFHELFGHENPFADVSMAGRTDTFLLSYALTRAGIADDAATHEQFRQVYLRLLAEEIVKPGTGGKGVMPGVMPLLERLDAEGTSHLALLTGNYRDAAQLKLSYFGLWDFFPWGVFGEESTDRNALAHLARERAPQQLTGATVGEIVVVGDTPHDIECAHAIGARAVGVATGGHTVAELRDAGADVVFDDLSDTKAVLDALS
jgi:phosphoglycolate phosphatase